MIDNIKYQEKSGLGKGEVVLFFCFVFLRCGAWWRVHSHGSMSRVDKRIVLKQWWSDMRVVFYHRFHCSNFGMIIFKWSVSKCVCLCVCVCVCVCACVYACMHICMCTCMSEWVRESVLAMSMCVCVFVRGRIDQVDPNSLNQCWTSPASCSLQHFSTAAF